ncbi:hypothetical protein GCM10025783_11260 [Amnibacterium soli]|uniref:Anti-sigma factor n=1 Tax=Amnibacterium soli TaxID=1282736 RepID=A0ABP8YYX8_9MICO
MVREDPEALRRRLYAPGASEADRARYEAAGRVAKAGPAQPAPREPEPPEDPAVPAAPPPARRRRVGAAIAGGAVVVALLVGGITAARLAADGQPSAPPPTPVPMSDEDRRTVQENLTLGNFGGIAAFLVTHRALSLGDPTRVETLERRGIGEGTVRLSPVPPETVRGRATVLLVTAGSAQVDWTTLRREVDPSGEQQYVQQEERGGFQQGGQITVHTYRYGSGDRPVELHVTAPDGVRWGAAVVFTD